MPMPEVTSADQIVLALGDTQEAREAKKLVKVVKPYKTEPDFYAKALAAARKKEA